MAIGIVGRGFVGDAISQAFTGFCDVKVYDTQHDRRNVESLVQLKREIKPDEPIFVCVPTPMNKDGSCNTDIIYNVLSELNEVSEERAIVILKSTIPPGTTENFAKRFTKLKLLFSPEFLTEANYVQDFLTQKTVIIGRSGLAPQKDADAVAELFVKRFPDIVSIHVDSTMAEMVKYITNTYLATKVAWANEIYQICKTFEIDYAQTMQVATHNDVRIGKSHVRVPGLDEKFGFSGTCLPKDLNALVAAATANGCKTPLLSAVWNKNLDLRPERDWESLKGRAVSD